MISLAYAKLQTRSTVTEATTPPPPLFNYANMDRNLMSPIPTVATNRVSNAHKIFSAGTGLSSQCISPLPTQYQVNLLSPVLQSQCSQYQTQKSQSPTQTIVTTPATPTQPTSPIIGSAQFRINMGSSPYQSPQLQARSRTGTASCVGNGLALISSRQQQQYQKVQGRQNHYLNQNGPVQVGGTESSNLSQSSGPVIRTDTNTNTINTMIPQGINSSNGCPTVTTQQTMKMITSPNPTNNIQPPCRIQSQSQSVTKHGYSSSIGSTTVTTTTNSNPVQLNLQNQGQGLGGSHNIALGPGAGSQSLQSPPQAFKMPPRRGSWGGIKQSNITISDLRKQITGLLKLNIDDHVKFNDVKSKVRTDSDLSNGPDASDKSNGSSMSNQGHDNFKSSSPEQQKKYSIVRSPRKPSDNHTVTVPPAIQPNHSNKLGPGSAYLRTGSVQVPIHHLGGSMNLRAGPSRTNTTIDTQAALYQDVQMKQNCSPPPSTQIAARNVSGPNSNSNPSKKNCSTPVPTTPRFRIGRQSSEKKLSQVRGTAAPTATTSGNVDVSRRSRGSESGSRGGSTIAVQNKLKDVIKDAKAKVNDVNIDAESEASDFKLPTTYADLKREPKSSDITFNTATINCLQKRLENMLLKDSSTSAEKSESSCNIATQKSESTQLKTSEVNKATPAPPSLPLPVPPETAPHNQQFWQFFIHTPPSLSSYRQIDQELPTFNSTESDYLDNALKRFENQGDVQALFREFGNANQKQNQNQGQNDNPNPSMQPLVYEADDTDVPLTLPVKTNFDQVYLESQKHYDYTQYVQELNPLVQQYIQDVYNQKSFEHFHMTAAVNVRPPVVAQTFYSDQYPPPPPVQQYTDIHQILNEQIEKNYQVPVTSNPVDHYGSSQDSVNNDKGNGLNGKPVYQYNHIISKPASQSSETEIHDSTAVAFQDYDDQNQMQDLSHSRRSSAAASTVTTVSQANSGITDSNQKSLFRNAKDAITQYFSKKHDTKSWANFNDLNDMLYNCTLSSSSSLSPRRQYPGSPAPAQYEETAQPQLKAQGQSSVVVDNQRLSDDIDIDDADIDQNPTPHHFKHLNHVLDQIPNFRKDSSYSETVSSTSTDANIVDLESDNLEDTVSNNYSESLSPGLSPATSGPIIRQISQIQTPSIAEVCGTGTSGEDDIDQYHSPKPMSVDLIDEDSISHGSDTNSNSNTSESNSESNDIEFTLENISSNDISSAAGTASCSGPGPSYASENVSEQHSNDVPKLNIRHLYSPNCRWADIRDSDCSMTEPQKSESETQIISKSALFSRSPVSNESSSWSDAQRLWAASGNHISK